MNKEKRKIGAEIGIETRKKVFGKFIVLAFIILLATASVFALGITPGRTTINFEPGMEKTVTVRVINNEKKDMRLAIFARGELANSIKLSADELLFSPNEDEKQFSYEIRLPSNLDPGLKETEIVVRQVSKTESKGETTISALLAIVTQLHVNVPYPGKFLKIDLHVKEAKSGEKVIFYVPVKNLGSERIESAKPVIIIYSPDGNEIARLSGNAVSLEGRQDTEFALEWVAGGSDGVYKAAAVVEYDTKRVLAEKQFLIGDFFLRPIDISVNNFRLGQVAKFNILVENTGNIQINDAFAKMQLKEETGKAIADFGSTPAEIAPKEKKELIAYWDTADVNKGIYTGTLKLGYAAKFSEKQIRTIVEEDSIRTEIIGVTAFAVNTEKGSGAAKIKPLYLIIAVVIIANIVGYVYYKKKKNQQSPPPTQAL